MRHKRRQAVVVAIADLVGGDGVVLVDDRDGAEGEQAGQGPPGVQVLAAIDEVVGYEQRLRGHEAVLGERVVPAAHQPCLTGGGDRLQRGHVRRPLVESESRDSGGDGTRRHDDDVVTAGAQRGNVGGELHERRLVDDTAFVGDRRRPDLDDERGVHGRSLAGARSSASVNGWRPVARIG